MSLAFHEIAEANHQILNPFTRDKLMLLGEICQLTPSMRLLDLCCGKGEMLCQWSHRWGISGIGVDISSVFIQAAKARTIELAVNEHITFIEDDASQYAMEAHTFDIVSCIGATWIGSGLVGTLKLMQPALKPSGLLLVGEPYWIAPPPKEAYVQIGVGEDDFTSLIGTLDRIESAGMELVEMVLADQGSWDRYVAAQWFTIDQWLRNHPDHPYTSDLRSWIAQSKRSYLEYQRSYFGWGVFVIRAK